jgi:Gp37 protein
MPLELDYADVEQAMCAQLKDSHPELTVSAMPQQMAILQALGSSGGLAIRYNSSIFIDKNGFQEETVEYVVMVGMNSLTGPKGVYSVLNTVARSLGKFRYSGMTPFKRQRHSYLTVDGDTWWYEASYVSKAVSR